MRVLIVSLLTVLFFMNSFHTYTFANDNVSLAPNASSAILMEQDTGEIIFEKNSDKPLPPASMTKIMTMLLIMEALEKGQIKYDDKVRTSERAASMGGSQVFLEPGEEMTVEEMLKAIAIASGNDASVAMAEHIAGSEEQFVKMMNEKAKQLGLKNTHFANAHGLTAENHYSSARDLAIMSRELLKYEDITKFTSIYEDYLRKGTEDEFWLVNTNKLVRFYPGVDGLKTGYTKEAKYCLAATAKKNGMRVIAVIMGSPTQKERNRQITEMLDYAFSQYVTHKIYEKDTPVGAVNVSKGNKHEIKAVTSQDVSVLTKKGENVDNIEKEIQLENDLKAPIQKGEKVGMLIIKKDGKEIVKTPLVAGEDVQEANWWQLFKRTLSRFSHPIS